VLGAAIVLGLFGWAFLVGANLGMDDWD